MKVRTLLISVILTLFFLLSPTTAHAQQINKRIEINLTNQTLYAYEGDRLIYNFPVSSGKWAPTPTGKFRPWAKLNTTRMKGGDKSKGTYYDLPNVPNVVYFYKGYAIHGAYWHNNFGRPMSHGCVNVSTSNMALLFPWIDMQTVIRIYGVTPRS